VDYSALAFAAGQFMNDYRIHSNFPERDAGVDALIDDQLNELGGIFRSLAP